MSDNGNGRGMVVAVVAAVVFGCAVIAAIVLMTWIVALQSVQSKDIDRNKDLADALSVRVGVAEHELASVTEKNRTNELRIQKLTSELAVATAQCAKE